MSKNKPAPQKRPPVIRPGIPPEALEERCVCGFSFPSHTKFFELYWDAYSEAIGKLC